ncbi:hypothetical protein Tco_0414456 [Tanacetum coccineum]
MALSIADQIALDDALVAPADRLKIGKCNLRLSSDITSKEATLQVVYDVLKLTPFYKAFQVTADAPEIYMQEFWASAYVHNRSVRFKMNNKKHIIGLEQFRDILQICPKVGNKKFVDPPLETEIIIFLASLGHSGDIRKLSDVNVNKLHQPWRSFAAVINKCLCGTPSYDSLRLSQAQILWGMYNQKNVDYAYLLWEDFIFKIENKSMKKGSAMYYPRFTKIVVNYVSEKIPSMRKKQRNEATQLYGAILPVALTNEDIRNSESYKEYYAMASGTIPPKTKGSKKKANTDAIPKRKPPTAPKEKKSGTGKQKTTELEKISEADLTEAEQLKIVIKRSRQETHSSHASGSGADEGTGVKPGVPDAPDYDSEDDISWKSTDDDQDDEQDQDDDDAEKHDVHETTQEEEDDDDHNDDENDQEDDDAHDDDKKADDDDDEELTESDNDGDDFVHPKLTTHDDEIIHEEDTEEDDSSISSSDEEDSDKNFKDTNTDLDGRDKVMTDVEDTHVTLTPVNPDGQQQSSSVSSGFVSNMLNPNQDTGVDDIFRQNTEATSFIDTNINRPPTPHPIIIQPQQQPIMTPATTTSSLLQNLPNFASLFGFDHRLKALEDNFSELKQTNQYAEALSSIPSTVDQYLAHKMQEAVDVAVQLKYDRIREEERVKIGIPENYIPKVEKFVNDRLESEVLVRSSKEANSSHAVAANLSELELKKILIDKMETNNSINRSDIQRQLYKDLVEAYEADKILLDTYGDTVTIKRPRDGADDDEEPSAGTDRGSKRRRSGKEPASTSAPSETTTKTAGQTTNTDVSERPADQEFETGVQDEQAEEEVQHPSDWFQKPTRLPSPDHAWNTSVPAVHESVQPWLSNLAQQDPRESFDELTDSTFDFSAFVMNRLNVQTLTPELLAGPTFELMKGTCKSLTELEYFCEEVYKATTEKLDWINPEGRQYPDLRQPTTVSSKFSGSSCYTISSLHQQRPGISTWWCVKPKYEGMMIALYSSKKATYKTRFQVIEDMLLLLCKGKVTNLSVDRNCIDLECLLSDVYMKRSNLRRQDAYTPYSDPRGFIYENKDKKNRLMRIDELHKFSDGTLDDVRDCSYDRLQGNKNEYLPETFCSQRDKAKPVRSHDQAIDMTAKDKEDYEEFGEICPVNIRVNSFTMKMEILLESTSNKLMVGHLSNSEDTLDDASKSQQKVYEKMNDPIAVANKQNCWTIDYAQINALYKDFVPQKELSAEQKYFPSSFIPSDKNSNATPSIPVSMPSESPLIIELDKIKNCFQRLSELIQKNCKRASIFYTSPEEIQLNDFCQDQLKPIVNELQFYFEFFKTLFQRDIKEMKDVFESTESELCELEKQNDFLKDQLLEVSLKHEVELSVLLNHECVDNSLHAEIEQLKKKSIEIQEGLQARIKILEKDVQRCEKQSVDFELKLQHEKEKHKWDSSFKNKNTNPLDYSWISKMEKLEDENVSLDFTVQSLIKERDNVKLEYQKLFNSIKKTRSQNQTKMDELIAHVFKKTYAYGAIRAENQDLLFTISELKNRLANVEKGKSVNTKFDKTNGSQSLLCVTPLNKHVIQKKTDVQKSEENHVVSKPVTLQTSPAKQSKVNSNKNVIAHGMYKVVTTHESQTNEAKHNLSSTGMNAASSVRRPMNKDSHVKNSVLANSKKPAKKVAVYVRKNKQPDITPENVISNKENVIDVDVANASKAKTLLCVSCMQNVLIPCHDNCFANFKLNVHSNVRRTLSTKSRTPKSYDTTYVVRKTRFSKESTLSKSLDTTYVVSKPKIDVGRTSKANDKVVQIVLWIVDSGCSKHMTGDRSLLKNFIEKFMGTVRFGNDNFAAITGYDDYI